MRIVVATHGHCFDGLASAALFTHLAQGLGSKQAHFDYRACFYGPGHAMVPRLDGDENALLDFQFADLPTLSWYFDHHATAFPNSQLRERFDAKLASRRYHFDPNCRSCARLISRVTRDEYGLELGILEPLAALADRIDSAQFDSAREAIDRSTPLTRFVGLVERYGDDAFLRRWVPRLLECPVSELATHPDVEKEFLPIAREHHCFVEHVKSRAIDRGSVVYADLTDRVHQAFAKFVTYALFPKSVYSVVLGCIPGATRISVGYNPWSGLKRQHNLGELCQAHGGGGHPVVGGIAFSLDATEQARKVALSLVSALEQW